MAESLAAIFTYHLGDQLVSHIKTSFIDSRRTFLSQPRTSAIWLPTRIDPYPTLPLDRFSIAFFPILIIFVLYCRWAIGWGNQSRLQPKPLFAPGGPSSPHPGWAESQYIPQLASTQSRNTFDGIRCE